MPYYVFKNRVTGLYWQHAKGFWSKHEPFAIWFHNKAKAKTAAHRLNAEVVPGKKRSCKRSSVQNP